MKRLNKYLILFLFLAITNAAVINGYSKQPASNMKRYNLKKACIEYTVSGKMHSGTEVLYFDNYGAREAKFNTSKIKIAGFTQETRTATYLEGTWTYTVDLKTKTGTKMENPILQNLKGKSLQDTGKEMMVNMGGKKVGTEKILGKTCDIWEVKNLGTRTWVWNWIPLKTESKMAGMDMIILATKISTSFDLKRLNRPKNINFREMGGMKKMLNKYNKSNNN